MPPGKSGQMEWECPSNIALVKYWGKKQGQLPINPSLSATLSESVSRVELDYEYHPDQGFNLEFQFNEEPNKEFGKRIATYIDKISPFMPTLKHVRLRIKSTNTFPHSTGIASSASSFGALALSLCSMENEIEGSMVNKSTFYNKASSLARLGSGSACRSIYGGYVLWGYLENFPGSNDNAALPVGIDEINPEFVNLRDSILVVHSGTKQVSSSAGHDLMRDHPYAPARIDQARNNLRRLLTALSNGNMMEFIEIIENEALTIHAMMMTSSPGYLLFMPGTLAIIEKVKEFRLETGLPAGFTLDAGPNLHLIYPGSCEKEIRTFIEAELLQHCENGMVIHDHVGEGPVRKK